MGNEGAFYLILLAILFTECLAFVGNFEVRFCGGFFSRFITRGSLALRKNGGLAFQEPCFFSQTFSAFGDTLSISPEGLANASFLNYPLRIGLWEGSSFVPFSAVKGADFRENILRLNGEDFAVCADSVQAEAYARLIEKLIPLGSCARENEIDSYLKGRTNLKALRAELKRLRPRVNYLRALSFVQFCAVFIVAPAAYFFAPTIIVFLCLLLSCSMLSLACVCLLGRERFRVQRAGALGFFAKSLFMFPFVSAHCGAVYSGALRGFHPAALAAVTLSEGAAARYLKFFFRDLEHPLFPHDASADARECAAYFNGRLSSFLKASLGSDPRGVLKEEIFGQKKFQPTSKSCCPRCLNEFETERDSCSDCGSATEKIPR